MATTTLNYETGTAYANATPRIRQIVQNLAGTTADLTTSFTWNPSGQIATRVRSNDSYVYTGDVTLTRTYAVNGLNQYTQVGPNAPVHDANGNLTSDGTGLTLTYDADPSTGSGRLVSASGTRTANLVWDPLGRLFETSANGVGITRFLYDGDELALEYDSGNTVLRRYVHSSGADDPLIWYEGAGLGTRRHLYGDIQGSIIAVTDATGTLSGTANAYDDWGVPGANNQGRFQYTGQAYIPELGMYHYKARIYSPTLGRFLQTDPIGYDDQVNLYAYVGNDPVVGRDPTGLCTGSLIQDKDGGCKGGGFVNGPGGCIGQCTSARDNVNAIASHVLSQSKQAGGKGDSDQCKNAPMCGGQIPSALSKDLAPLFRNSAFKNQVRSAWEISNPYRYSKYFGTREHGFWSYSKNGVVKVGSIFAGNDSTIDGATVTSNWADGFNILTHTHPFFFGYAPFSPQDIKTFETGKVMGIAISFGGIYVYDGR